MRNRPDIKTAIPRRRYQIGDFSATVLGDIDSGGGRAYRFILAMVALGDAQPSLYVCCEPNPSGGVDGRYAVRVVNDSMSEVVDSADHWGDLDTFAEMAVDLARQVLGMKNEQTIRLM
ncbi:hypothetical protein F2Q65_03580 [Thiohalocapsa marina]|uniref:Uncharacterized protein n=1 Tax=Thiohalocapsa marina TaxID=424902 RepID=A0A5M8FT57_9GAMM|nr:hypothetical protein [Thiohalocapsa marina]KAA6186981.1 hypothetical protein F2Q65_03580 [Thiohalocapsa marina]